MALVINLHGPNTNTLGNLTAGAPCGDGLQYRRRTVLPPRDGTRCIERQ